MTIKLLLATLFSVSLIFSVSAQNKDKSTEIKYRRSSLHTILLETEFPKKDTVIQAYYSTPFPDKYNNHTIGKKSFNPQEFLVSDEEIKAAGIKKTETDIEAGNFPEIQLIIENYFEKEKIAQKMIGKWFDRDSVGAFSMGLIGERGMYNASDMEAKIAKGTVRGSSSLADAGEELIKNTFVVVSKLKFVSNEHVAAGIREVTRATANEMTNDFVKQAALIAADAVYEKTKEGYSVWTTAFLYQLEWNDSTAAVFYNDMWVDKSMLDSSKIAAFDKTNLFKLEFIGKQKASSLVTFSLKKGEGNRTDAQVIKLATSRNIEAVFAKLQKKYDVFKTKTPLYTGYPITAKVGMKEGLEGGEKFEVLEQMINQKTGLTEYTRKGVVKVDKKLIWDNRFNAGEDSEGETLDKDGKPITVTSFKGGKKYYSGMLIRQLK